MCVFYINSRLNSIPSACKIIAIKSTVASKHKKFEFRRMKDYNL